MRCCRCCPAAVDSRPPGRPGRRGGVRVKVLAAMSGGVDSSVAAARMVDAGHDVVGVHLALSTRARHAAHRLAGLLLQRGRLGRPPRRRCARNPVLCLGFRGEVRRRRDRRLRVVLRARRNPQPVRALQSAHQVLGAVRAGPGAGLRHGGHRPLRPAVRRAAAPRRRSGQGPVLRAGRADRRAAAPRHVSDRGHPQAADPRGGGPSRPGRRREARQPRHLLHPVREHPRLSGRAHRGSPRHRGRCGRRGAGQPRRGARIHHRPAQRPGHRRAGTRRPPALRHGDRRRHRDRSGGRGRPTSTCMR